MKKIETIRWTIKIVMNHEAETIDINCDPLPKGFHFDDDDSKMLGDLIMKAMGFKKSEDEQTILQ